MRRVSLLGLAILAMAPGALQAQDVIDRPLNPVERVDFVSGGSTVAAWGNVLLGPYSGDIVTAGYPTLPGLTLYCVDYTHEVYYSSIWNVNVTGIGTGASDGVSPNPSPGTLGNTRLGNTSGALTSYRQAAFLASLFDAYADYLNNPSFTYDPVGPGISAQYASRRDVWSGIHAAIWTIMTPGFPGILSDDDEAIASALGTPFLNLVADAAQSGYFANAGQFDDWYVLTDVRTANDKDAGIQEYLIHTIVSPEPETYVLLFSGLLLLGVMARRRLRESRQA